jgi:hypothetical protein
MDGCGVSGRVGNRGTLRLTATITKHPTNSSTDYRSDKQSQQEHGRFVFHNGCLSG